MGYNYGKEADGFFTWLISVEKLAVFSLLYAGVRKNLAVILYFSESQEKTSCNSLLFRKLGKESRFFFT